MQNQGASDTPHYENVPFEVPEGWCWCIVEDVFELNPKNKVEDNVICGFIPMALVDDGFGYSHSFEERPWGEVKKGYCHFQNGDIGIAKISPCFENRKSTIFSGLPNGIGAGTTELSILRGSLVDCRYFLFLFQSEWYLREGTKYFKGVVGQQRVNKEIFTTLQIPLPPLAEQQRIANAIETCMFLCSEIDEYRDGVHSAIVASKAKILDLAIHGKLVPQDDNDEPASDLLRRINPKAVSSCDNPHYEGLPNGWTVVPISTLCDLLSGRDLPISDCNDQRKGIPYLIGASNLINGEFDFVRWTDKPQVVSVENDLLISCKGTIGDIIANNVGKIHIARQFMAIRIKHSQIITENYLKIYILACLDTLKKKARGVIPGIAREDVLSMDILLPPITEQRRIVDKTEELYAQLNGIEKTLQA